MRGSGDNLERCAEPPMREWPDAEKPRERLAALGARRLTEAELLALILRTGGAGLGPLGLAHRLQALAAERGGFRALGLEDLTGISGMGKAKASAVLAALEWGTRPAPSRPLLDGPKAACDEIRALLGGLPQEHVAVIALDARRKILAREWVSQGTLTQSLAHPREIFRAAVKLSAAAVVVGHNHPSGDPSPSPDDFALTRRLREAAEILGIPLLDHVIVTASGGYSFAQEGWPGMGAQKNP
jgi:DNA repair protein RadC